MLGTLSQEEEMELQAWLSDSEENMKMYAQFKILWNARKVESYSQEENIASPLAEFNKRISSLKPQKKSFTLKTFLKYAAIFAGLAGIGLVYWLSQAPEPSIALLTKQTNENSDIEVIYLSDGTRVWLNENTKITYPETFVMDERIVTAEGEVFFDVKKDTEHPFIVSTSYGSVEVTGTSFNINTRNSAALQTVLVSGSVILLDRQGERIASLKPGQCAEMGTKGLISIKEVDTREYTEWQEGLIKLENATLPDILTKISQVYKVEFEYDTARLQKDKKKYNFVFRRSQTFDTVFGMLKYVAPVKSIKVKKQADNKPDQNSK